MKVIIIYTVHHILSSWNTNLQKCHVNFNHKDAHIVSYIFIVVIFDPASFYGHHEFELGIATMFGGFDSAVFEAYHKLIPKAPGFGTRQKLYQLFHYLNHW